jgi:hypothetical protein
MLMRGKAMNLKCYEQRKSSRNNKLFMQIPLRTQHLLIQELLLDLQIAGVTPALLSTKELWSCISNPENPGTTLLKLGDSIASTDVESNRRQDDGAGNRVINYFAGLIQFTEKTCFAKSISLSISRAFLKSPSQSTIQNLIHQASLHRMVSLRPWLILKTSSELRHIMMTRIAFTKTNGRAV